MSHPQTIYLENISNVVFSEGVVRLELSTKPLRNVDRLEEGVSLPAQVVGQLVLSLPALLRLHSQLGKTLDDMSDKGIIKKENNS